MELNLPRPTRVDCVTIMEDIRHGERVRRYAVDGLAPGNRWQQLCEGTSVGHKRIQSFDGVEVAKLRLRITESIAQPIVRSFVAYDIA